MAAASHVIGVDIGGTKIAAGLVSFPEATVRFAKRLATPRGIDGAATLQEVKALVFEVSNAARENAFRVDAIGIGICEIVDLSGNVLSSNAVSCDSAALVTALSSLAPVRFEADVRAAALAEARYGAGKQFKTFLYVTIGTGISSCLMIQGQPFLGAGGATGTIASSPLPHRTAEDLLTLEDLASGPGLVSKYRALGGAADSAEDVLKAAVNHEPRAIKVIDDGASALASTIGMLVGTLDPEGVIIGGGLGLSEGLYRETLIREIPKHVWWKGHRKIPIRAARLGAAGPIIGAAAASLPHVGI